MQKLRLEQIENIPAGSVVVTPSGNLASSDVQAALQELQGDIDTISSAGYLTDITGEDFTDLSDTPSDYSTHANKFVRVNSTPDGLEFVSSGSIALSSFNDDLGYIDEANLSLGTITGTTVELAIDTGTNATIPAATASDAGVLIATDKVKLNYLTVTQGVDLDNLEQDVVDLVTLSGVAANSTTLGAFTGTTIQDSRTIKQALQDLETYVEAISGSTNLSITNKTGTTLDVASDTGTDATIPAATTSEAGLLIATDKQKLDYLTLTGAVSLDDIDTNLSALITLSGRPAGSTHLGTFTGDIIDDNTTLTSALQSLETALNLVQSTISSFEWYDSVIDKDLTAPPGGESTGDRYLIGTNTAASSATGAWATHDGEIAEYNGSGWDFTVPTTGGFVSVDDEPTSLYSFGGTTWTERAFENTTASTGLTKVVNDIRLASGSAGYGLSFSAGTLAVDLSELNIEGTSDVGNQYVAIYDGSTTERILASTLLTATNVSNTPSGNLAASTVQGALNELQGDIDGITSNVTHTGEVTGATSLTIDVTAISNRSLVTASSGDHILVRDATDGTIKKVDAADFLGGSGDTTNNYSSLTAPQDFIAVSTGASEDFTVASTNDVLIVSQNGQQLDDSEWNLVGTTLTVTPDIGIESGDEILVQQATFATTTGGFKTNYTQKTGAYTVVLTDYTVECTSNTFTVTLPTAVGNTGKVFVVKNTGAGTITLDGDGAETIDGSTTQTLNQWDSAKVQSNGSNWILI